MSLTPVEFVIIAFLGSVLAGLLGSLLGLGGGIIVIPLLTLGLGVDIRYAIGASIVAVIATSSGAGAAYVRDHISNIKLGMFLEVATTLGAISGAFAAGFIGGDRLYVIFAAVMIYTALMMLRSPGDHLPRKIKPDALADRLQLHAAFHDKSLGREVSYRVTRSKVGLVVSYIAGMVSGLLGVGGGVMKVPAMNLIMNVPLKAATATSNFMIGVTAAASAGVYFS
ncbi:MAG: sulfite exporter TauE/SafE family protein, partial [Phycisphaeraceae bacterium]